MRTNNRSKWKRLLAALISIAMIGQNCLVMVADDDSYLVAETLQSAIEQADSTDDAAPDTTNASNQDVGGGIRSNHL